jgi:Trypsin-like peptidase domain
MHQTLADAVFRVECGQSSGSGFSFRHASIVATNFHVIAPHQVSGNNIQVVTESGVRIAAELVGYSPENQYDFALLRLLSKLPSDRHVLQPKSIPDTPRGMATLFAGFPHGIHDLLVHEAVVSGPAAPFGFYIDGSVNGGNSGGPIVERASGQLVGLVTQRRFLGAIELGQLRQQVSQLAQHCQGVASQGSAIIMGINFGAFAQMMSQNFLLLDQLLQANANSGIGIGFSIEYMNAEYTRLGLP